MNVSFVWGVEDIDKSHVGSWDSADLGKIKWDSKFTVSPAGNQLALINLCDWLETESQLVKNGQVYCWIKHLNKFISDDSQGELELPLDDPELFNEYLARFVQEDSYGIEAF